MLRSEIQGNAVVQTEPTDTPKFVNKTTLPRNEGPIRPLMTQAFFIKLSVDNNSLKRSQDRPFLSSFIGIAGINSRVQQSSKDSAQIATAMTSAQVSKDKQVVDDDELFFSRVQENLVSLKGKTQNNQTNSLFTRGVNNNVIKEKPAPKVTRKRSSKASNKAQLPSLHEVSNEISSLNNTRKIEGSRKISSQIDEQISSSVQSRSNIAEKRLSDVSELKKVRSRSKSIFLKPPKGLDSSAVPSVDANSDFLPKDLLQKDGFMIVSRRSVPKKQNTDLLKSLTLEEQKNEQDKFIFDLRIWKATPNPDYTYQSQSYDDVLPHIRANFNKEQEEKELHRIRYTKLPLVLPLTKKSNVDLDESQRSQRRSSMMIPIRPRKSLLSKEMSRDGILATKAEGRTVSFSIPNQDASQVSPDQSPDTLKVLAENSDKSPSNFSKASKLADSDPKSPRTPKAPRRKTKHSIKRSALGLVDNDDEKDIFISYNTVSERIKASVEDKEDEDVRKNKEEKPDMEETYRSLRVILLSIHSKF